MAKNGDWVLIKNTILSPSQRAPQVPSDTALVPLLQWVKGHLLADAELGDTVSARTLTGREVTGELVEVNPAYSHSFGHYLPQLHLVREGILKARFTQGEQP